ncbi:MAG: NADP-dependent malic enzyme [Acholeplasmataceae bacterium]
MSIGKRSLELHRKMKGKISIKNNCDIQDARDLSLVYTPGVASSCLRIKEHPDEAYELTAKNNTVAVISDGSAVLGLGNIGPLAAIPVMEGKCAIFKRFAGLDAIPIVLATQDTEEIIRTITYLSPSFGGINLEDISAPRCFEIERRLREALEIPVFHDDQHGTAIASGAALINALKVVGKKLDRTRIVINGAGSAGLAIADFLLELGVNHLVVCDKYGIIDEDDERLNEAQKRLAGRIGQRRIRGKLRDALIGADVLIGVSVGNVVDEGVIRKMGTDPIVFALANPNPEISRDEALRGGARIYGSGASDEPNQINNALVFPGLFKGLLSARARRVTTRIEIAACQALARVVKDEDLDEDLIIADIFNEDVVRAVSEAVIGAVA